MIIYIAGKVTNEPDYKNIFAAAESELTEEGHIVLNPAKLPEGMPYESYMPICFGMIDAADAVYMLPNYQHSLGAQREMQYASAWGKAVVYWGERG